MSGRSTDWGFDVASYDSEPDLGPDERDRDLMDGSWEEEYYRGRVRRRDWSSIMVGLGLLVLVAMVVQAVVMFSR